MLFRSEFRLFEFACRCSRRVDRLDGTEVMALNVLPFTLFLTSWYSVKIMMCIPVIILYGAYLY